MKKLTLSLLFVLVTLTSGGWVAQAGTPRLQVYPEVLNFDCEVGRSYTRTFTVSGMNLTQDLTLTMFGDDFAFSMDRTGITVHEAEDGVEVTVRYAPHEVGEFGANIWIRSSEVSASVHLAGVAYEGPSLTASTTSLSLNSFVGGEATKTFTVTGNNVEEGIHLILEDPSGAFSIDPTEISYNDAENENTVTVTYQPTDFGPDTATICIWSHHSNDVVITLYGKTRTLALDRGIIFIADVYDLDEENGTTTPAAPAHCGKMMTKTVENNEMGLSGFDGLFVIRLDNDNHTATLQENWTQSVETEEDLISTTTTETHYRLVFDDAMNGTLTGTINEDGSISFGSFVIETEKIVTVTRGLNHQVISSETISYSNLYSNVRFVESNGTHRYSKKDDSFDPGTVFPMINAFNITLMAPVYIEQRGDTVMVYNLYNMDGANMILLDNGFFEWPWQQCGYKADGGCWYNYTYYRSYQPSGEVRLNVMTYPHRIRGVNGKVTEDSMTWGQTTFGTGWEVWSDNVYENNVLAYNGDQLFECEKTVWHISDVTWLIDGILYEDPEVLTHPASDVNGDGSVTISDVTSMIDQMLFAE